MKQATAALRPAAGANARHSHGSHSHIRSQCWFSVLNFAELTEFTPHPNAALIMVRATLEAFEVFMQVRSMCTQVGSMRDVGVQADVEEINQELAQREEQRTCELLRDAELFRRIDDVLEYDDWLGAGRSPWEGGGDDDDAWSTESFSGSSDVEYF